MPLLSWLNHVTFKSLCSYFFYGKRGPHFEDIPPGWSVGRSVAFSLRIRTSTDLNDAVRGRNAWRHLTMEDDDIPSGKHTKNHGESPFSMGISTINGHFQ